MIPTLSYKFYYSKQYLEWKKCIEKAKKEGYNKKKCDHIYSKFLLVNSNSDNIFNHIEKGVEFQFDRALWNDELPKKKL